MLICALFTVLRLVDNKAILYFEATSTSDALTWFRGESMPCDPCRPDNAETRIHAAINLHIPSSKA